MITIHHTPRPCVFQSDLIIGGAWIASAISYDTARAVASEAQWRHVEPPRAYTKIQERIEETMMSYHLNAGDPGDDDNPDYDSTPATEGPSELREILPAHCAWCWGAHSAQHCSAMLDILLDRSADFMRCENCGDISTYSPCAACVESDLGLIARIAANARWLTKHSLDTSWGVAQSWD